MESTFLGYLNQFKSDVYKIIKRKHFNGHADILIMLSLMEVYYLSKPFSVFDVICISKRHTSIVC